MELKYEKTMVSNSKGTQIWQPKNAYIDSPLWMPLQMPCLMPFETPYKNEANEERTNKSKVMKKKKILYINNVLNCMKYQIKNQNLHEIKCYPLFFFL